MFAKAKLEVYNKDFEPLRNFYFHKQKNTNIVEGKIS